MYDHVVRAREYITYSESIADVTPAVKDNPRVMNLFASAQTILRQLQEAIKDEINPRFWGKPADTVSVEKYEELKKIVEGFKEELNQLKLRNGIK